MRLPIRLRRWADFIEVPGAIEARRKRVPLNLFRFFRRIEKDYRIKTVLDIGANRGEYARWCAETFSDVVIHAFEPLKSCQSQLDEKSEQYPNIKVHTVALGNKEGSVEMFENESNPSSSILPMLDRHREIYPHTASETKTVVELTTLDKIARTTSFKNPIFLKADVQGYELEVLKGATSVLADCAVVVLEVMFEELYEGQSDFRTMVNFMHELNFDFLEFADESRSKETGALIYADAAFVNRAYK